MINPGELRIGDWVGHPSWGDTTYMCVLISPSRFTLELSGGSHVDFAFSNSQFFIAQKVSRERKKSGFGKWIEKYDQSR